MFCHVGLQATTAEISSNIISQKLLEDVPLTEHECGAPAHSSRAVRDVLYNTYHDRRIRRGGSMPTGFESSGILTMEVPEYPCVCSSC
jgi:hypothetical protein